MTIDTKQIQRQTIIDTPAQTERQTPRASPIILSVAAAAQTITPWGTNPRVRDMELRTFWTGESWLASVVYLVTIRNASFAWEVTGADPTKPQPKNTINKVNQILKNSDRGEGWQNLIIKTCIDLYCLAGNTRIALGGDRRGKTKTIAQIVKDKDVGPVLSLDENSKLVEKYVNEWHTTPLADRKWYWLSAENASNHSGDRKGGIYITSDHPMLTQRGWVRAQDILPTDKIATSDPEPTEYQKRILLGGLMGDMSMTRFKKRAIVRFSHSVDQKEYLEFKKSLLGGFSWTGQNTHISKQGSQFIGVNSKASLGLAHLYDTWYDSGIKEIRFDHLNKYFSPELMAIWFMDDGSKQSCETTAGNVCEWGILSTESFSPYENKKLAVLLTERGFECKAEPINGGKYHRLRFSVEGFSALSQYISKHVLPSMRYKVAKNAPEYDPNAWQQNKADVYYDNIAAIEQRDYRSGKNVCQTTYHIGVEDTHNFVAGRLISHNTQDNGAFWEIIRVRNNPNAPVINIAHLDSSRCQRTGDPQYPVIYTDRLGREKALPYWRVQTLEEFPSPWETAFNLQYCAVTRALLAAQIIESISVYKQEKVGGHFTRAVDIVSGVTQNDIDDAVGVLKEQLLNRNVYRYSMPVLIPGIDPSNAISHVHIDLASLPDNFDEDTSFKWYVAQLAAAFGVDYQEIAPLMTGNLGAAQQSEIMHLKTRGKGPAVIMALFENVINNGLIPGNVEFRFKEQDLRAETEKANARFTRGKDRAFRLKAGEIDMQAARVLAVEDGDLPEWLAKEVDKRGEAAPEQQPPTQQTNREMGAQQIEGGIETNMQAKTYLTLDVIRGMQDKLKTDPYAFYYGETVEGSVKV